MKFKAEIDQIRTLKKGMKLTLAVDDKQTIELMKHIYNFMDKPVIVELLVDDEEQAKRLNQITEEQRKKVYAILRDMEAYIGDSVENLKEKTKASFIKATEGEDFSLSDCSKDTASQYIEYLIELCMEMDVPLKESPKSAYSDTDRYLTMCLRRRICAICGQPGEVHHVDAIGMGRDRRVYDDSAHRKMCLCRKHHTEAHTIGLDAFQDKYHVYGVLWEG